MKKWVGGSDMSSQFITLAWLWHDGSSQVLSQNQKIRNQKKKKFQFQSQEPGYQKSSWIKMFDICYLCLRQHFKREEAGTELNIFMIFRLHLAHIIQRLWLRPGTQHSISWVNITKETILNPSKIRRVFTRLNRINILFFAHGRQFVMPRESNKVTKKNFFSSPSLFAKWLIEPMYKKRNEENWINNEGLAREYRKNVKFIFSFQYFL